MPGLHSYSINDDDGDDYIDSMQGVDDIWVRLRSLVNYGS